MTENKQSRTGSVLRSIFNLSLWMDYSGVRKYFLYIKEVVLRLFVVKKADTVLDFKDVQRKKNIKDEEVSQKAKSLFMISCVMLLISLLVFAYSMTHLYHGAYAASFLSFIVFILGLTLSFRYHYWFYSLKAKKLNVPLKEWFLKGLLGVEDV